MMKYLSNYILVSYEFGILWECLLRKCK